MAVSCDKNSLFLASVCYMCLAERELIAIRIYLLCAQINGTTVTCDPKTLLAAAVNAGYLDYSSKEMLAVETYLQCQLASGGGGGSGGGFTYGDYGGGQPNFTPASGTGAAIDTSNGTEWQYYSGAWH